MIKIGKTWRRERFFFKEVVKKIGREGLPNNTLSQNYTIDKSFNKVQNLISHPFGDGFPFF